MPATPIVPTELQLDTALQLIRQSELPLPSREGHALRWLQTVIDHLVDLSSRDSMTGLANRRSFEMTLSREIDRVARTGEPTLLLTLDIDLFKNINDSHGHAVGDRVIQSVGHTLLQCVRPMDTVARVGGEEFAVLLPNCPPAFGSAVAERIRQRIAGSTVTLSSGQALGFTVSIGGAFAPQWVRTTHLIWMERADLQLYRAKSEGRNRVCLESTAISEVSAEEKNLLFGHVSRPAEMSDAPPLQRRRRDASAADGMEPRPSRRRKPEKADLSLLGLLPDKTDQAR
ncbi:GGDEF domain-containing protein [Amphibiibacter pelophylacis]|uniref:GGDEF domain-containing protein n=1 Tax=Amphibiibacter pelophylacis TaxID=1799477 RepID=A0ACC6P285_9BURK